MDELLNLSNLTIQFETDNGLVHAVEGVSLDIKKGETLGLVGETGAGKTTTALGILGLIQTPPGRIVSGEVEFMGQDLRKCSNSEMRKIRGAKISMIFQDPMTSLNPVQTVSKQIEEVIRLHQKTSRLEAVKRTAEMLELVGISPSRMNEYPHQFSGGMKQRVVIAMALACRPALLIADEPTTALDVTIQAQVLEIVRELKRELQTSMLMITHDLGIVAEICDRVAIMYAGEIVEVGTLTDIYNHTRHPYTIGLFGSLPSMDKDVDRLHPIKGFMPDPSKEIAGCKFADRCDYCTSACFEQHPELVSVSESHGVRCINWDTVRQGEGGGEK